jgi:hypothetical protein
MEILTIHLIQSIIAPEDKSLQKHHLKNQQIKPLKTTLSVTERVEETAKSAG